MNNFIKSFLFLFLLVSYYLLIGSFFLTKVKIKRNKFSIYVITGWMITFAIGWITGFPAQLYSKSWNYFAIRFQVILLLVGIASLLGNIYFHRNELVLLYKSAKEKPTIIFHVILNHLKKYWFLYFMAVVFTWFSITNLQSYTLNNYTDDHYIAKMVHMFKSNKLFEENQYNGQLLKSYGKFSLAIQQQQRMFNTYEIVYTNFANLFGISFVTFAKFTMTLHNYYIWFLAFQLLGSVFLDSEKSQYSIALFALLLIPEGFSARGSKLITIRIFENWRNQTAIYMGGSIVRNTAFPLLIYFSYFFYNNISGRSFFLLFILCIVLVSFQTTAISYIILFFPLFLVGLILNLQWKNVVIDKQNIKSILVNTAITALIFLGLIFAMIKLDDLVKLINIRASQNFITHIAINKKNLTKLYKSYIPYYNNLFKLDTFARIAWIPLFAILIIAKDRKSKILVVLISLIYWLFRLNKLKLTLALISLEYYCTPRMLHSMELLIIFVVSVVFISIIECIPIRSKRINVNKICILLVSLSIPLGTISYMNLNMKKILKYNKEADGVISAGYSTLPLTENDQMMPNVFIDTGKYFDSLPNKKYLLYIPKTYYYKNVKYTRQYLLISSKKIAYYEPWWNTYWYDYNHGDREETERILKINNAWWRLDDYLGKRKIVKEYSQIEKYLIKGNLNYAFFTDKKVKDLLVSYNWKVVNGSDKKGYYILKRI